MKFVRSMLLALGLVGFVSAGAGCNKKDDSHKDHKHGPDGKHIDEKKNS